MKLWRLHLPLAFAVIATFFTVTYARAHKANSTWKVVFRGYLPEVHPSLAVSDYMSYILNQTHEPLFRYDSNHLLSSRVLDSWEHDEKFQNFSLCISPKAQFEPGSPLLAEDLSKVFKLYPAAIQTQITPDGRCMQVSFDEPQPTFFFRLTNFTFAPSRPTANPQLEIGLGPFRAISADAREIVMVRKVKNPAKRFDRIEILSVDALSKREIDDHSIQDFNWAPADKYPEWVDSEYRELQVPSLNVYALVLNIADERVRKAIYNCFDIEGFQSYFPSTLIRNPVASIYPIGILGAVAGRPRQICQNADIASFRKKPLVFLTSERNPNPEYKKVLATLSQKLGVEIRVKDVEYKDRLNVLLKHPEEWDLTPTTFGSDHAEAAEYLEALLEPKESILKYHLRDMEAELQKLKSSVDENEKLGLATDLNTKLLGHAVVLPLFQKTTGRFYYPKDLKNLSVGSKFTQYPNIDDFE